MFLFQILLKLFLINVKADDKKNCTETEHNLVNGFLNLTNMDLIKIQKNPCSYNLTLAPYSRVINKAEKGHFVYNINTEAKYYEEPLYEIDLKSNLNNLRHKIVFDYTIDDIKKISLNISSVILFETKFKDNIKIISNSSQLKLTLTFNSEKIIFVKENNTYILFINKYR